MQFIDHHTQQTQIKAEIDAGIANVLAHGQYILGPEVRDFEAKLADFVGATHALGCANGTDAILLPLMAWGIGPGDAVFCPSFTYLATAEVIALMGATPVFVDVHRDSYNMDPNSLKQAISEVRAKGDLTPRAIIAVDLFGQIADYPALAPIAKAEELKLISDCAQGFGSTLKGAHPLHWVDVQTTSFFPAKPLGCYGDGGAVMTNDAELSALMESLRFHGKSDVPYDTARIGLNSRLDTLQAAILLPKLAVFSEEIKARGDIAARYSDALVDHVMRVPHLIDGAVSSWAQYTIEVPDPVALSGRLKDQGIPSARDEPGPTYRRTAYADYPVAGNGLPNTMDAAKHVISLPMHAYLTVADQDLIIKAVQDALAQ